MPTPDELREYGKLGGRPRGRKNDRTLKREEMLKHVQQRTMDVVDLLLDEQIHAARGQSFLFKVEKYYEKRKDKNGKEVEVLKQKPPELVTNQEEIRKYIENKIAHGELEDSEDTYYFITTKEPDTRTINDMFNRVFGRSVQPVAMTDTDGEPIDHERKEKADKAIRAFLYPEAASGDEAKPRKKPRKK